MQEALNNPRNHDGEVVLQCGIVDGVHMRCFTLVGWAATHTMLDPGPYPPEQHLCL